MRNIRGHGMHDCLALPDQLKIDEEIAYVYIRQETFLMIPATVISFKPYHFASHKTPQKFARLSALWRVYSV